MSNKVEATGYVPPDVESKWDGPVEVVEPMLPFVESVESAPEEPREYVEPFVGEAADGKSKARSESHQRAHEGRSDKGDKES